MNGRTGKSFEVRSRRRTPNRRLRELRINAGLSPEDLGHRVGVSGKTIRNAEAGNKPTVRVQFAIAAAFELQPLDLWPLETQVNYA